MNALSPDSITEQIRLGIWAGFVMFSVYFVAAAAAKTYQRYAAHASPHSLKGNSHEDFH